MLCSPDDLRYPDWLRKKEREEPRDYPDRGAVLMSSPKKREKKSRTVASQKTPLDPPIYVRAPPGADEIQHLKKLFGRRFNPLDLPGVSRTRPDRNVRVVMIFPIYVAPRKDRYRDRVWCSICQCPKFHLGGLYWFSDGYIRPVGHCCSDTLFPHAKIEAARRAHFEKHDRQNHQEFYAATADLRAAVRDEISGLLKSSALKNFEFIQYELKAKMPTLNRRLVAAISSRGGELGIYRRVRQDIADAIKEDQRRGHLRLKSSPLPVDVFHSLGRLSGRQVLDGGIAPQIDLKRCLSKLERLEETLLKPDSHGEWSAVDKELGEILTNSLRAQKALVRSADFSGAPNIELVVRYANLEKDCPGHYEVIPGGFSRTAPNSGETVTLRLPRMFAVPNVASLQTLKRALKRAFRID